MKKILLFLSMTFCFERFVFPTPEEAEAKKVEFVYKKIFDEAEAKVQSMYDMGCAVGDLDGILFGVLGSAAGYWVVKRFCAINDIPADMEGHAFDKKMAIVMRSLAAGLGAASGFLVLHAVSNFYKRHFDRKGLLKIFVSAAIFDFVKDWKLLKNDTPQRLHGLFDKLYSEYMFTSEVLGNEKVFFDELRKGADNLVAVIKTYLGERKKPVFASH